MTQSQKQQRTKRNETRGKYVFFFSESRIQNHSLKHVPHGLLQM